MPFHDPLPQVIHAQNLEVIRNRDLIWRASMNKCINQIDEMRQWVEAKQAQE
ncbi:hypothetical protein OH456_06760 [Vibrio sp. La 4.2.2]|uniref:hypothetical protein n=1 Tax=Vibrio sp. La 4.2.2 TaxID=2998830 RepID=UPI0022CE27E2|nr:hypothetical protein [Vibrio sp. La 4.2.2]MDA0107836.1 hypothetical protein [Vibrio sp. La 4.2.2]